MKKQGAPWLFARLGYPGQCRGDFPHPLNSCFPMPANSRGPAVSSGLHQASSSASSFMPASSPCPCGPSRRQNRLSQPRSLHVHPSQRILVRPPSSQTSRSSAARAASPPFMGEGTMFQSASELESPDEPLWRSHFSCTQPVGSGNCRPLLSTSHKPAGFQLEKVIIVSTFGPYRRQQLRIGPGLPNQLTRRIE